MDTRAFILRQDNGSLSGSVEQIPPKQVAPDEVEIAVEWSGINYKDALVATPQNRVARSYPLVPGVDLAGTVLRSNSPAVDQGTAVVAHGYDIGVSRNGGFAEIVHLPADLVVALPPDMTTRHAMIVGTAGFTALMCLKKLVQAGITPSNGPILVTGATGGVGSMAVTLLARNRHEVVASTAKSEQHPYLHHLGASRIVSRTQLLPSDSRKLGPPTWAGAIDCVGGETLAAVLRSVSYGGAVAATGLRGGSELHTNVFPFITRGVSLLGVDAVSTPIDERRRIWNEIPRWLPLGAVEEIVFAEVTLEELPQALQAVSKGAVRGRILLNPRR